MPDEFDFPPIVYKYRTWDDIHHQNMLRKNELYLSSPADFNDPFDCRIPENYYLLDTQEKISEYIDGFMERNTEGMLRAGEDPDKQVSFLQNELTENIAKFQAYSERTMFKRQDDHYGVLSLSSKWDNILMWSHYAKNHRGYCIGFHEPMLRNAKMFGKGGMVIPANDDNFPQIDPRNQNLMEKAIIETHSKAQEWAYENEYRLTCLMFPSVPSREERKRFVPDEFIAELIIGLQTSDVDRKEIVSIAAEKKIPVYQAIKVPFKFLIERIQIA